MKNYKIYRNNSVIYDFLVDDTTSKSLSGNKYVSFTVSSRDELDIKIGDYIEYENERYELFEPIDIEESNGVFTYPLTFYFQGYKLNNSIITDEGATTFAYHGEVSDFMALLINSLRVDYPEFTLGTIENASILDLSFDNSNCMAALQTVCENAEMEWDITGTTITVKRRIGEETDHVFEYGKNKGSYSVKLSKVANASVTTRMIGKGGTINLPANYISPDSPKRLNLGDEVLEKNVDKYGKITGVYVNENIYPRLINKTVLGVTVPGNIEEAGSWKIKLDIPFNLSDYYAKNEVPVVKFQTGDLTGLDFEIVENSWNNTDKTLSIIVKEEEDGYYIPNENRQPRVGDVFVLLNINMPQSYIDEATQELREATQNELNKKCEPQYAPSLSVQKHYIKKKGISLNIGDGITVKIGSRRITTRIIGLTETSDDIRVELGDQMLYTYDTKVNNTIEQIQFTLKQLINIDDIKRLFYNLINAWYPKWFNQKLHKEADVQFNTVQSDNFASKNFTSGPLGSGHRIKDGNAEFQNLTVRGQFSVFEYLIQQVKAIGGKFCVSPASMRIGQVEETEDGYKCFFNTDGGTIMNPFVVGDQAFHQVFDGSKMKRYWRLVTEIGADYFVLSKSDCEANSGIPEADEEIVLLGNRTDRNRQSAIMISAYDNNSPYIAFYNGINSYSFEGKEPMRTGNLNGIVDEDFGQLTGFGLYCQNVYMKGVFRLMSGKTVEQSIGEVQSNIDNLQIGTENLISWKMMLEWNKKNKDIAVYGQDEYGVYLTWDLLLMMSHGIAIGSLNSPYVDIFDNKIKYKTNTQYVISIESKSERRAGDIFFYYTDGSRTGCELSINFGRINLVSTLGKTVEKIVFYVGAINNPRIYNISLIEGNKPLQGFPVHTDDLPNNINLADGTKEVVVELDANNFNCTKLLVPKIKPNIAYYITFNAENLAGEASEYRAILYKKDISGNLSTAADTSNGGIILTHNDFDEQEGYLLLYAGVWGSTAGNSVKYTDVMLVEGRFPATAYSPSVNEQDKKIETLTTSVTNIQADTNGIRQTVTETVARVDAAVATETIIDLRDSKYDQSKYYPVTFNLQGRLNTISTRIELDSPLDSNWGQPSWATHSTTKSFSLLCVWTTNGAGWGVIGIKRVVEAYNYGWSSVVSAGNIGQMPHSSNEYIYLRGGGKYRFRCTNNVTPVLHESSFTVIGETINILTSVDAPTIDLALASSEVLQLKDQITLKVSKGDIINQINVSTEGVRINASKLEISGATIFKDSNGNQVNIFGAGDYVFSINNKFKVDKRGNAEISGIVEALELRATDGEIGPFFISSSKIYGGAVTLQRDMIYLYTSTTSIMVGTSTNHSVIASNSREDSSCSALFQRIKGSDIASVKIGTSGKEALYVDGCTTLRGGLNLRVREVSLNTTLTHKDCVIVFTGSSSYTITFPSNCDDGKMFWIITANAKPNIKLPTGDSISNTSGLGVSAKWHVYIYDKGRKQWMYSYMNI